MTWTDAQQNPHDYLAPGAGVGYSGGISGQYPIGIGGGSYAGGLNLGDAPSAGSVPIPGGRPGLPGSMMSLPGLRSGPTGGDGLSSVLGKAGPDQLGLAGGRPVTTAQALAASSTKSGRYAPGYQGVASVPEIEGYIREQATARGIDPNYAVSVYHGEGLSGYVGDKSLGGSYGPYQLYMGGGLGNRFAKQTGLDPRDPSTWQQQVDYALDTAANEGWGAWNGRPGGRGGATRTGLAGARAIGVSGYGGTGTLYGGAMPNPNMRPGRTTDARGGQMSSDQFLTAIGPQPRPTGPNDYLVPPGQDIDALTYANEPAASPTNAVFRLPGANTPPPVSPAATPSIAGGTPYTVQSDDTLWGIAAQTLGDPSQWPTIAQANGITRGQERNIQPGQRLLIPGGAPGAPSPMPNTTAQGFGPMPPVPTPQARPPQNVDIPLPRSRPSAPQPAYNPLTSANTGMVPDVGASDLTLTRARLLDRNDQNVVAPPQVAQVNPDRFSGPARGPLNPRTSEEETAIRQQLFNSATQRRGTMGTPETQMSIDRPPQARPSPPAGPGMDMSGYIPPVSRMEAALGNVPMALPTQAGGTSLPPPMPGPNLPGPIPAQSVTFDPYVAAAIAQTPAITDRDIRIITARTPPVYVAPDGSRIWQIR